MALANSIRFLPRRTRRRGGKAFRRRLQRWRKRVGLARRWLRAAPASVQLTLAATLCLALFAVTNLVYHVVRKPTEMFYPLSGALNKLPAETWRQYGSLFEEYSTTAVTPELLAALAQIEGAGNPVAHTYWRWRPSWHPFAIYEPASSAVGMYQMTDAAFADARGHCIRHHRVVEEGCWASSAYTRILPSEAVELTAVYLDLNVAAILARRPKAPASPQQQRDLATIIHLCGAGPAAAFARRGFRLAPGERCGDHDAALYLAEVRVMERQFQRLAAAER